MSTTLYGRGEGQKNVTTAATPVQLHTAATCEEVIVTARPENLGTIAVGFSNAVRATAGSEIGATLQAGGSIALSIDDVSKIWIDASTSGEGVSFTWSTKLPRAVGA